MALKMNIPLPGGIEHADGYVRVTDCRVSKKDDEDAEWFLMVDVAAYKDADARADKIRLSAPAVDKFKFPFAPDSDGASPADAYVLLKASGGVFADAVDV